MTSLIAVFTIFGIAALIVAGLCFSRGGTFEFLALFATGAGIACILAALSFSDQVGYGNAAERNALDQNHVYCVAAKIDDAYILRKDKMNENLLFYLPGEKLSTGQCFTLVQDHFVFTAQLDKATKE